MANMIKPPFFTHLCQDWDGPSTYNSEEFLSLKSQDRVRVTEVSPLGAWLRGTVVGSNRSGWFGGPGASALKKSRAGGGKGWELLLLIFFSMSKNHKNRHIYMVLYESTCLYTLYVCIYIYTHILLMNDMYIYFDE